LIIGLKKTRQALRGRRVFVPLGIVLAAVAVFFAAAVDLSDGQLTWRIARADTGDTVTVADGTVTSTPSVPTGTSDTLDVTISVAGTGDGALGVSAYNFGLAWDQTVFTIDSIVGGDAPFDGLATPANINNTAGTAQFNSYQLSGGQTGSFKVAEITVTGACATSGPTPLNLTINELGDVNGDDITATAVNGTVTCTAIKEPDPPTGVTAVAGDTQADVSWTAPGYDGGSAITGYTVASSPGGLTATAGATATSATVTGLTNGTSYTFTVTATNALGTSASSTASSAVVPFTVPGAPTGATAVEGNGLADVSWTAPSSDGFSPILYYTVTSSPGSVSATSSTTTVTVTGLSNGTEYTFTVTATNAAGAGPASSASNAVTPATVPDPPTSVVATPAGETSVSVSWTAGFNGGRPILYYVVLSSPGAVSVTSTTASATVTGLVSGTPYTFTVTATNALGTSAPSSPSNEATPTPFKAYPFMRLHRDYTDYSGADTWDDGATHNDGATGVIVGITDIRDASETPITGVLLGGYEAELRFDGTCINVLSIRAGRDFAEPIQNISTSTGVASFNQANITGDEPDSIMAFALVRLIGDANTACNLEVVFTDLVDKDGVSIAVDTTPVIGEFRRGNAREDAVVNIFDVLFGAQYDVSMKAGCVGIRAPGGAGDTSCVNVVNLASVKTDGARDRPNIFDVLFIAMLDVSMRDINYLLVE